MKHQSNLIEIYRALENTSWNPPLPGVRVSFSCLQTLRNECASSDKRSASADFVHILIVRDKIILRSFCAHAYVLLGQILDSSPLGNFYLWNKIAFNLSWPLPSDNRTEFDEYNRNWASGPLGLSPFPSSKEI